MLHELIEGIARVGGETALGLLFALSIVSVAISGERTWFFMQRRLDIDRFAQQLLHALRARDWSSAKAIAEGSAASVCLVVSAGLTQIERGSEAVCAAFRSAMSRERMRLERQLGVLRSLGDAALIIGALGTLLNFLEQANVPAFNAALQNSAVASARFQQLADLLPAAAGLLVALPAWLAARALCYHVRRITHQMEFVTQLVLSQVVGTAQRLAEPVSSHSAQAA